MNEQENHEPTAVTPPPFHPQESPGEPSEATSPTLAEQIAAMGLEQDVNERLTQLTRGMESLEIAPEVLTTLARGITHDEDVENANATGYLRGRNEKIEAVMHQRPSGDDTPQPVATFPSYRRRSIWER